MIVILAIDQSASINSEKNSIGWCVMVDGEVKDYGELKPDFPDFDGCRKWLAKKVKEVKEKYGKPIFAIETVYYGMNVRLFQRLVEVQAHFHAKARELRLKYVQVTPQSSFTALTGKARNTKGKRKEEMRAVFEKKYDFEASEHIIDAVAIALWVDSRERGG